MTAKFIDMTGKTEDEAVAKALSQLGLDRDEVSVEVLERAKSGFLGLGACPAKIRVYYGPEEEAPAPEPAPAPQPEPVQARPRSAAPEKKERPERRERGPREKKEIGMHSLRGGTEAGTHTVSFFGPDEVFEITHRAASRQIFVNGALHMARLLPGRPSGVYDLQKILFGE